MAYTAPISTLAETYRMQARYTQSPKEFASQTDSAIFEEIAIQDFASRTHEKDFSQLIEAGITPDRFAELGCANFARHSFGSVARYLIPNAVTTLARCLDAGANAETLMAHARTAMLEKPLLEYLENRKNAAAAAHAPTATNE